MKKVEMIDYIAECLSLFELPLVRSGLSENYMPLPAEIERYPYADVLAAYKWIKSIREGAYLDWKRVWNENKPHIWELREESDFAYTEIKIIKRLQHELRVRFTIKSQRPKIFKKGYQDNVRKSLKKKD